MQIDIVSDTVCPWCFIGKRRIERAMALRPDVKFDVVWRPYRLDPSIPREGVDRRAYLKAKFGDSPRTSAMGEAIRSEGESEGIAFAFDKIARSPNTLDSHRLIRWSANAGKQDQIVERLFQAYFIEGQDIGNSAVLSEVAAKAGMDGALVARLLGRRCGSRIRRARGRVGQRNGDHRRSDLHLRQQVHDLGRARGGASRARDRQGAHYRTGAVTLFVSATTCTCTVP